MFGLMTVKRHEAILAKADSLIDDTAQHVAAEEFSGVRTLPNKVALAIRRLEEARSNAFRNRQMALTLEDKLAAARAEAEANKVDAERYRAKLKRDREYHADRRKQPADGAYKFLKETAGHAQ